MGLTYCEIKSEINLAQVFLWLQEKYLFGLTGTPLWNLTPGSFRTCDMVCNLLLSGVMNLDIEARRFYRRLWLEPTEG